MLKRNNLLLYGLLIALFTASHSMVFAASTDWTLNNSIDHMLKVAPEMRAATAEVDVRRGELTRAGAFPNPSIELRADQKLGVDDGSGGTDLTQIAISQPLPLGRLGHQRAMATAQLSAAEQSLLQQRLLMEYHTAQVYHQLQLAQARLKLAEERLAVAESYTKSDKRGKDPIVRYLSKRERLRLSILRENARQSVATAEGRYNEAMSSFRSSLALPMDSSPKVIELGPVPAPPSLAVLQARLDQNPALVASMQEIKAARAGIDVARSQRLADPVLTVFRERDYLGGSRRDYNGIMISVQVPLWNGNNGSVSSARAEMIKAESKHRILQRDLSRRLRLHEMHLGHLISQAADYYSKLVLPTEHSLNLARKSFAAGQTDLLTLIDAYNIHFDAHFRYLGLLQQGWMEAADLRLADGLTLHDYRELAAQSANTEVKH
ncbi:MAG: TolC family protein [Gammaproteobacteria bacterium]|jgi:outer membrane protein, heavy metal efflux system